MARSVSAGKRSIAGLSDALAADCRAFATSWPTPTTRARARAAEQGLDMDVDGGMLWHVLFVAGMPQARWFLNDSKMYRVIAPDGLTPL